MELNKRTLKQIELLSVHYDFDLEKGIVTVPLCYATAEDMIDAYISRPGKPKLSSDTLDYLQEIIQEIPKEFTIDFSLTVEDYGDYTHIQLLSAIEAAIENTYYYHDESRKKDNVLAVCFIIIGVLALAYELIGEFYGWFGAEGAIGTDFIISLLDIIAWVFIWEGGAILFLNYDSDSVLFHKDFRRVQQVRFVRETGETLSAEDNAAFEKNMIHITKGELVARNIILFSFPLIIALSVVPAAEFIQLITAFSPLVKIFYLLFWIVIIALTVANISFYRGKGPLKDWAMPLAIIMLVMQVMSLIGWSIGPGNDLIFFIMDGLLILMVLVYFICLIWLRRQRVDVHFKKAGTDDETE